MIDNIMSFGDSFVYGTDLSDCKNISAVGEGYSNLTWPALIAKDLNLSYQSFAVGGSGNQQIANFVLNKHLSRSLVIINWSWIDRFDYYISDNQLRTLHPTDDTELEKFYYKHLHSEISDKFRSLCYIQTTHEYLKKNNIRFISTIMDTLLLDDRWNVNEGICSLQQHIRKDISWFPKGQTFLDWSRANGYPESDNWHPLERAHEAAAEYWKPIYEKLINTHITITKD